MLESEVAFNTFVNGKTLARMADYMERIALQLRVTPMLEFFSADPNEIAEEFELAPMEVSWSEQWFDASDGLATVRALLSYVRRNPSEFAGQRITEDLEEFDHVLSQAQQENIKWHLGIDS